MPKRGDRASRLEVEVPSLYREGLKLLSPRESEVLTLAAAGYMDKEICSSLGVTHNTLRTYWRRIRSKVGEGSRSALAVVYTEDRAEAGQAVAHPADWEIDLDRSVFRKLSDRAVLIDMAKGEEMPFEDLLSALHPEDAPNVRRVLDELQDNDLSNFTLATRVITRRAVETTNVFISVERDAAGHAFRLLGTRAAKIDARPPQSRKVEVGYWQRDIRTGEFTADAGFCAIFRIDPKSPTLRADAMARFHPEEAELTRTFVDNTVRACKTNARATHRLLGEDGSYRWITTDLRIEYVDGEATYALGTVMAFDHD